MKGWRRMIICECGHGIDEHNGLGCWHIVDVISRKYCTCRIRRDTVEARYWARRMMKERDTLQDQLDVVIKIDDDTINTWRGTCDILQAKLDEAIMKIESVCRGEYSGEDPYYILRNYIKSIKE